jgi:hypothetical protein
MMQQSIKTFYELNALAISSPLPCFQPAKPAVSGPGSDSRGGMGSRLPSLSANMICGVFFLSLCVCVCACVCVCVLMGGSGEGEHRGARNPATPTMRLPGTLLMYGNPCLTGAHSACSHCAPPPPRPPLPSTHH